MEYLSFQSNLKPIASTSLVKALPHVATVPGPVSLHGALRVCTLLPCGVMGLGAEFETGQYMNMLVGGDALPFEAGKIGRTTFSFVPNDNATTIPPTLSITYNVSIIDSTGTQLYSNQFDDSDGVLDLELMTTPLDRSSLSNQTGGEAAANQSEGTAQPPHLVTWGPDLTDQGGVASDGTYQVQGPVLTKNEDYTITVSITSIDNTVQPQSMSDDFLLPSTDSTDNSLVSVA